MHIPKDLLLVEARENTLRKVDEVISRFAKDGIPLLDPEEDMKVRKKIMHITQVISIYVVLTACLFFFSGTIKLFPESFQKNRSS